MSMTSCKFLGAGQDGDQGFCLRRHLIRCAAPPRSPPGHHAHKLSSHVRGRDHVTVPDQIRAHGPPHPAQAGETKGLMAGITCDQVCGPQAEDRLVAQLHLQRRADCPI